MRAASSPMTQRSLAQVPIAEERVAPNAPLRLAYLIGGPVHGGTERHLLELLRGIDRTRFDPTVVFINPQGALRQAFQALEVPILDLNLDKSFSPRGIARLLGLAREFKKRKMAILHAYQFHGNLYASLVAPFCDGSRLLVSERGKRYGSWHRRLARRYYYRRADRILINCEALREYVKECCSRNDKLLTIPNGIDRGRFLPDGSGKQVKDDLKLPHSARIIGSVGRLLAVKGHRFLVDAFISLAESRPEVFLLIAGGGPEEAELTMKLGKACLQNRVRFVGYQFDVRPYLEAMDYFVLPSLSEAHSMALLEAMSMGKPVIATSVGGNRETVSEKTTGLLVPPASADAIRNALLVLMNDPGLAAQLGGQAQRAAARYDLKEMVKRHEDLYLDLVEGAPGRGGRQ